MSLDASRIWIKDPASTLTVGLWWQDVIARGDTLSVVAWTVPTGLTLVSEGISAAAMTDSGTVYPSGEVALARISGGTAGADYTITCQVTTAGGDIDERSITVQVRQR